MGAAGLPALEVVLLLTTGLVVGRGALRTTLAIVLACACVALPLALPRDPAWLRALCALGSLFAVLRTIEVLRDARTHRAPLRMFAYVAPMDAFTVTPARPRFDASGFARALAYGGLAALGALVVLRAPMGTWRWPVATLGCALLLYATMDAGSAATQSLLRAVGIESAAVQNTPIASRTVAEFWSRRWNRAVGGWLRRHCFAPLARRGRVIEGSIAAFVASAALHFWPVLVSVGLVPAIVMGCFFVVQALLVVIESRLGVARWPAPAAHAWTVTVLLASSPLFTVPTLRILGLGGS